MMMSTTAYDSSCEPNIGVGTSVISYFIKNPTSSKKHQGPIWEGGADTEFCHETVKFTFIVGLQRG